MVLHNGQNDSVAANSEDLNKRNCHRKSIYRDIFTLPLISFFRLISAITKILGKVLYLGIIVGLWFAYDIYVQIQSGVPFVEANNKLYVCAILLPFVANLISLMSEKFADYLYFKS